MFFQKNTPAKKGLKIIIVGCGKVGRTLVEKLSAEGHDITIIDKKASSIQQITNMYDCMGIEGNGASYSTQKEAGIEEADLIIAVTNSDELNLLCCTIATQVAGCAAIARVRTPEYSAEVGYLREKLGLALVINPELESAREMARILYLPSSLEVNSFAHGQAELVKFRIPPKNVLDGLLISELGKKLNTNILIGAVERNGEVFIPSGNFRLQSGDIPCLVSTPDKAREFLSKIGQETRMVKNTMIIGGGKSSYYLADELIKAGVKVKIIEADTKRAETLSDLFPTAVIINADGADEDVLIEEGLTNAEAFVPLTGIDEENIILTMYAKRISSAKVITKINHIGFSSMIGDMDLGSVVYPKYLATEAIIAYVRARHNSMNSNIETLYHMYDSRVECIEFSIGEESEVTGTTLMDLPLKKNLLIASISRNGSILFPSGMDSLQVGDNVMIITTNTGFKDIRDILA